MNTAKRVKEEAKRGQRGGEREWMWRGEGEKRQEKVGE